MRTLTPTRPIRLHQTSGRYGESNPRHDVHSIGCCHYTRSADLRSKTKRKRRDSNPHRPTGRPRLANACDETDIRLSSKQTSPRQCPRQDSNLDLELRGLTWSSIPPRGRSFVIHSLVIGHSESHIPARTRTRNAAFEAPH